LKKKKTKPCGNSWRMSPMLVICVFLTSNLLMKGDIKMNIHEISDIFGKQLRSLSMDDFEKRTFRVDKFIKHGI